MQIFAKKFYGFDPSLVPVITFSQTGSRDALLRKSKPGDRIVYIAVQDESAQEHERGKILGMAEIGVNKVSTLDFVKDLSALPRKYFDENGDFRWQEGIPMLRAWRFTNPVHRHEMLPKEMIDSQATRLNAILLPAFERDKILAMAHEEIGLPDTDALMTARLTNKVLSDDFSADWRWEVSRMAKTTHKTVKNSNGQMMSRVIKNKNTDLSETETQIFLRKLLEMQNYKCAITGQKFMTTRPDSQNWLAPSVDRIDSNEHYTIDNIQIVTKSANRAKSDISPDDVMDYFAALQFWGDGSSE